MHQALRRNDMDNTLNDKLMHWTSVFFVMLISVAVGKAQILPKPIEMLQQFERTFENVQDFTATIEADVDMDRLRIPQMNATIAFKRPDRVHYSAPGFALLPREGMTLNPVGLREKYVPTFAGRDTVNGALAVRLDLAPRDAKAKLKAMTLWLDTKTWTPLRMETVRRSKDPGGFPVRNDRKQIPASDQGDGAVSDFHDRVEFARFSTIRPD
jgi:outer membrane lipoprotein-sorting protein